MATKKIQLIDSLGVLSYNSQTLTEEQQVQARTNIGAGEPQVQADWSQNDETSLDYIKNRTHWKSMDVVEEIHNGTIDDFTLKSYDAFGTGQEVYSKGFTISSFPSVGALPPVISVSIDGVSYSVETENSYTGRNVVLDSGERFKLSFSYIGYNALDFYVTSGLVNSEFIISAVDEVFHKIDHDYLPDDAVNVRANWGQYDSESLDYVLNRTHGTFYGLHDCCNGVLEFSEYSSGLGYRTTSPIRLGSLSQPTSVTVYFGGGSNPVTLQIAGSDEGIESNKVYIGAGYIAATLTYSGYWGIYLHCTEAPTNLAFRVVAEGVYTVQLDETYIPDTIARSEDVLQSDWEQTDETQFDYIKNKPPIWKDENNDYYFGTSNDYENSEMIITDNTFYYRKAYLILTDEVNGIDYIVSMRNGNLVTYCAASSIAVTTMPTRTVYLVGDVFNPDGMIVTATCADGSTREIKNYTYDSIITEENINSFVITYTEGSNTFTTTISLDLHDFSLADFEYAANDDGTYTLTAWKGTYNGEASTRIVVPNSELIIV